MNSLEELLGFVLFTLQSSDLCLKGAVRVVETSEFAANKFALKVRAALRDQMQLQIYLYINKAHVDYAYQLFQTDSPILRWDNKEHYQKLSTYPHHFHDTNGDAQPSPLTGNPESDLLYVLDYLTQHLKATSEQANA